jgi:NADH:ubiquinone reductase (H+-translocating)
VGVGSLTNDFGIRGVTEHAVPLENPTHAERFNRRMFNACLRAQTQLGLEIARSAAPGTDREIAGQMSFGVRREGGHFFVPDVHPLDVFAAARAA